ncbi:MAG: hypothetical protein U9M91_01680 [Chloroflexota bacterium]|nr:hypothetical protein [Chloroflexota bacterium]
MAIQFSPVKLEKPALSGRFAQFSPPQADESYFEKLAAFGLACLAAAIVGKLTMTALTPRHEKDFR